MRITTPIAGFRWGQCEGWRDAGVVAKHQELAYAEATRAIGQQQTKLDNVRTRVGVMFSASSVAAAFLGNAAIGDDGVNGAAMAVAVAAYTLVAVVTLLVLLPYKFEFAFSAETMLKKEWADLEDGDLHGQLALYLEDQFDRNEEKIGRLFWGLEAAAGFTSVEIVAWLIAL